MYTLRIRLGDESLNFSVKAISMFQAKHKLFALAHILTRNTEIFRENDNQVIFALKEQHIYSCSIVKA